MSHNTLANYYDVLRGMKRHGYGIDEVEGMIPFERDLYVMGIEHDMTIDQRNAQDAAARDYEAQLRAARARAGA